MYSTKVFLTLSCMNYDRDAIKFLMIIIIIIIMEVFIFSVIKIYTNLLFTGSKLSICLQSSCENKTNVCLSWAKSGIQMFKSVPLLEAFKCLIQRHYLTALLMRLQYLTYFYPQTQPFVVRNYGSFPPQRNLYFNKS